MSKLELSTNDAFEQLFKVHYSHLCAVGYYMTGDENAAMDIVQDFFLYCWAKKDTLQITHNFKSYAVRSIRNASLNYLKKVNRVQLEVLQELEKRCNFLFSEELTGNEPQNNALWEAISKLPAQRKKIFLLSNIDGLKYQEIAARLGISINTVKTQIRLAFQYLRTECKGIVNVALLFISVNLCLFFTHF
ncbi:RNA polymerase sigma-70 factor [Arachidicoccus terrestris]|uniref:RNA polymerase sigma-70 factor n=1 Tax=Arachidicoccus terrestris TaxID=2875539 RepID=UPI001CC690F4|nr:RNA polymerase sigma-70 factor [Arachidicoccus terrestris]UAY55399.1 RNA polymerase sigma-70 factor [Arachidicoccus terrestris]